ncbi:hypothetical protein JZU54_04125, partial [bacterium]|nr:hypothetical protein [bacterium]
MADCRDVLVGLAVKSKRQPKGAEQDHTEHQHEQHRELRRYALEKEIIQPVLQPTDEKFYATKQD